MIAFVPLSGKKYPILGALAHGLIYLQIDSFWSKKYLLVYNGKSFHSQTGCSLPGNFANFRGNIDILIDKLATSANHLLASVRKFVCVDSSEDCS